MKKVKLVLILMLGISMDLNAIIYDECATMKPDNYTDKCRVGGEGRERGTSELTILARDSNWVSMYNTKYAELEFKKKCNSFAPNSKYRDYFIKNCVQSLFDLRASMRRAGH